MEHIFIKNMVVNDNFEGYYIMKNAEKKQDKNGNTFISGYLMDASGQMDFRVWSDMELPEPGSIVFVSGIVSSYKDALQANVSEMALDANASYNKEDLVPCAPAEFKNAFKDIMSMVDTIEDEEYRTITKTILEKRADAFASVPAAKSVHHAFIGGLSMHTLNMMRLADYIAAQYGNVVNRSLLLAGTALHDIGKLNEFDLAPTGLVSDYSLSGSLLGHLVIGCTIVHRTGAKLGMNAEKLLLLEHLLASHHGEPEFGALKTPMCAEAYALSAIDMMDSRMELYRTKYDEMEEGSFARGTYIGNMVYKPIAN